MHFQSLLQLAIAMASGLSMVMPAMAAPTSDTGLQSDNELTSYWGHCKTHENACHWSGKDKAGICTCAPNYPCKVDNGGCYYVHTTMVCNCQTNG
ncbi:hypothetical protein PG996_008281 [Apiospora saccharicola]|uniref:Uncharacterized protein n=1 Tax=Apiospora saccharicola TaxID=335842 RepID=A0ABR1UXG5_9PEZI